ncbi:MAG: FtsH protease activity modulator HflK [Thiomonas arsenitoxydans]|uniref:Protein HflK n=1 Tax=Thiomonas arsenitoxydans (strain DSM 22701 / CIP 110005 / 3As) TaxID=426114 RepID=A0A8I1SXT3_THIA3|nr:MULTISPECIES: FtsH protease activity modulator HflK [Thiomonas]MBN8744939.1 FtsH protease activity modulator HflK [Thiomonas arsenitoxydans]ODU95538.1 MAG: HflK protein [Thiomonas sp. SCN 64-16]
MFNLNDPRWGKDDGTNGQQSNNNQDPNRRPGSGGPPDLDELWRDFNRKLNGLFGKKRGSGNGGGTPPQRPDLYPSAKGMGVGVIILVVIGVLGWLSSGFFIVQEGQQAAVTRFGKLAYITDAGFHWRLPYPFEADEIVNVSQVRSVEVGRGGEVKATGLPESAMLTEDENIVDVRFAVQYRIDNVVDYLYNNRSPDDAVSQAAETAVREVVGNKTLDYVLYEGREQVASDVQVLTQKILDRYKTGIVITTVTLQNVQPPEQVQAAFDDAIKAGQDRERLKNEAQAYANNVIPRAQGTASRLIQDAEAYKAQVVAQAQGDTSRFDQILQQYEKAPQVTRERMYLQTMQDILSSVSKVMVDSRNNNNLLYMPLDKLLQQSAGKAPTSATAAPAAPPTTVPTLPAASVGTAPATADSSASAPDGTAPSSSRTSRDTLRERNFQ